MAGIPAFPTGGSGANSQYGQLQAQGLCNTVASHKEVMFERKEVKAFCLNCGSKRLGQLFLLGSRTLGRLIGKAKEDWQCPHCEHAVMWRSKFKRATKDDLR